MVLLNEVGNDPHKSLLNVKLDNSFVTVNVLPELSENTDEITATDLEAFADSIDFSMLN